MTPKEFLEILDQIDFIPLSDEELNQVRGGLTVKLNEANHISKCRKISKKHFSPSNPSNK